MGNSKKENILAAAYALFEEEGFHATGVDAIAGRSGVTKRTLYRLFGSKENLALEVIRRHDESFRCDLRQRLDLGSRSARDRLLGLFDYYGSWFASKDFRGCLFIRAMVEFQASSLVLRNAARDSKELLRLYVERLCGEMGVRDAAQLSSQLQILLEGSIIAAQAKPGSDSATVAKGIAQSLIDAAIAEAGSG